MGTDNWDVEDRVPLSLLRQYVGNLAETVGLLVDLEMMRSAAGGKPPTVEMKARSLYALNVHGCCTDSAWKWITDNPQTEGPVTNP
ncbi:MAG: hypothetical protein ACRDU4_04045 [Mycobacterium sp.]